MKRLLLILTLCLIGLSAYGQGRQNVGFLPIVPVKSSAKEASHVISAKPGALLCSVTVSSDTDQWILVMDSATVPANGAVTLLYPPIHVAANSTTMIVFQYPLQAANGISICNSNANSFTKTIGSADCIFAAQTMDR